MKEQSSSTPESTQLTRRDVLRMFGVTSVVSLLAKYAPEAWPVSAAEPGAAVETAALSEGVVNRFRNSVLATDAQGNPMSGVRVLTADFPGRELIPYIEGGWKGAPANIIVTDESGAYSADYEFAQSDERAIVIGGEAAAVAEEIAQNQGTDLPPHQKLQNATVEISDVRLAEGEGPREVSARLFVSVDPEGESTGVIAVKNASYRMGIRPVINEGNGTVPPVYGDPIEAGVYYGLLPEISEEHTLENNTVMTVTMVTEGTPSITFQTATDTITVSNQPSPESVARAADLKQSEFDESDLLVTVADTAIEARQQLYEELVAGQAVQAGVGDAAAVVSKLEIIAIRSSNPDIAHNVKFNRSDGSDLEAVVSDVVKGDRVLMTEDNTGALQYEASGENGHVPTVTIITGNRPTEPHPVEPEPVTPDQEALFIPGVKK